MMKGWKETSASSTEEVESEVDSLITRPEVAKVVKKLHGGRAREWMRSDLNSSRI